MIARGLARGAALRATAALALGTMVLATCGPSPRADIRLWSDHFEFRVNSDPSPPHAREPIIYTVTVLDKDTRQLIQRGEGQIYANSIDKASTYDALEPAAEAGTYRARLSFITAGDWAVGMRFRPDSTKPLEKVDWVQTVRGARPINERPVR